MSCLAFVSMHIYVSIRQNFGREIVWCLTPRQLLCARQKFKHDLFLSFFLEISAESGRKDMERESGFDPTILKHSVGCS